MLLREHLVLSEGVRFLVHVHAGYHACGVCNMLGGRRLEETLSDFRRDRGGLLHANTYQTKWVPDEKNGPH